ncbi:MAG: Rpn family recombination-promoting nuclease/putative transposase, partial [Spirochaetaceae bacterium]|nr:Rpn family recombination-promoting nuclease/putative transposase [Spirochaetaceae bacterium]
EEDSRLADWLRFLKAEEEEEFKMLAAKNPVINEAYCKLQVMSKDEANRMIYEARLKAQRDEYSRMQGARREGREEGRTEGLEETARNALSRGFSVDIVREITGLSEETIARLLQN